MTTPTPYQDPSVAMRSKSALLLLAVLLVCASTEGKRGEKKFIRPPLVDLSELMYNDGGHWVPDGLDDDYEVTDLDRYTASKQIRSMTTNLAEAPAPTSPLDGSINSFQSAIDEINGKNVKHPAPPVKAAASPMRMNEHTAPAPLPYGMSIIPGAVNNQVSVQDIAEVTSSVQPEVSVDTPQFSKAIEAINGGALKRFRGSAEERASYMPGQIVPGAGKVKAKNLPSFVHLVPGKGTTVVAASDIADVAKPVIADSEYPDPNLPQEPESQLGMPTVVPNGTPAVGTAPQAPPPKVVYVQPTQEQIEQAIIAASVAAQKGEVSANLPANSAVVQKAMSMLGTNPPKPDATSTVPKGNPTAQSSKSAPSVSDGPHTPTTVSTSANAAPAVPAHHGSTASPATNHAVAAPKGASRTSQLQERAPGMPTAVQPIAVKQDVQPLNEQIPADVLAAVKNGPPMSVQEQSESLNPGPPLAAQPNPSSAVADLGEHVANHETVITAQSAVQAMAALGKKIERDADKSSGHSNDALMAHEGPVTITPQSAVENMEKLGQRIEEQSMKAGPSNGSPAASGPVVITATTAVSSMEELGQKLEQEADQELSNFAQQAQQAQQVAPKVISPNSAMKTMLDMGEKLMHQPHQRHDKGKSGGIILSEKDSPLRLPMMDLDEVQSKKQADKVIDMETATKTMLERGRRLLRKATSLDLSESVRMMTKKQEDTENAEDRKADMYNTANALANLEKEGEKLMHESSASDMDEIKSVKYSGTPAPSSDRDNYETKVESAAQREDISDVEKLMTPPNVQNAKQSSRSVANQQISLSETPVDAGEDAPQGNSERPSSGVAPTSIPQLLEVMNEIAAPVGGDEHSVSEVASEIGTIVDELLDEYATVDMKMATYHASVHDLQQGIDNERQVTEQHHRQVKQIVEKFIPMIEQARTAQKEAEKDPDKAGKMSLTRIPEMQEAFKNLQRIDQLMTREREKSDKDKGLEARAEEIHADAAGPKTVIKEKEAELQQKLSAVKGYADKLRAISVGLVGLVKHHEQALKDLETPAKKPAAGAIKATAPSTSPPKPAESTTH